MGLMKRWCAGSFVLIGMAAPLAAQEPAPQPGKKSAPPDDATIAALLNTSVISVNYDSVPFEDVIQDLATRTELNFAVRWYALEVSAVEKDTEITLHLSDVSIAAALHNIVKKLGGADVCIKFEVADGVIVISTEEELSRGTIVKLYNISDLIRNPFGTWRIVQTPALRLQRTGGDGARCIRLGGRTEKSGETSESDDTAAGPKMPEYLGGCFGGFWRDSDAPWLSAFLDVDTLLSLIRSTVDPESWRDSGGNVGSLSCLGQTLVVMQSRGAQREVEALLQSLRDARPPTLTVDAVLLRFSAEQSRTWRKEIGFGFPYLNGEQFESLLANGESGRALFEGSSSGFSGERLWFSHLHQREILAGAVPVLGESGIAFQPVTTTVEEGLELMVTPILAVSGHDAILDVQMAWAPPAEVRSREVTLGTGSTSTLDLTSRQMNTIATRVLVPIGRAIALSVASPIKENEGMQSRDWLIVRAWDPTGKN